jgi:hypothetical protein
MTFIKSAFRKLNKACTETQLIQHFNLQKQIILQYDATCFAIADIFPQSDGFGILPLVNFYTRICSPAEQNCHMNDWELPPNVEAVTHRRHFFKVVNHKGLILCDHKNLESLHTSKVVI